MSPYFFVTSHFTTSGIYSKSDTEVPIFSIFSTSYICVIYVIHTIKWWDFNQLIVPVILTPLTSPHSSNSPVQKDHRITVPIISHLSSVLDKLSEIQNLSCIWLSWTKMFSLLLLFIHSRWSLVHSNDSCMDNIGRQLDLKVFLSGLSSATCHTCLTGGCPLFPLFQSFHWYVIYALPSSWIIVWLIKMRKS